MTMSTDGLCRTVAKHGMNMPTIRKRNHRPWCTNRHCRCQIHRLCYTHLSCCAFYICNVLLRAIVIFWFVKFAVCQLRLCMSKLCQFVHDLAEMRLLVPGLNHHDFLDFYQRFFSKSKFITDTVILLLCYA